MYISGDVDIEETSWITVLTEGGIDVAEVVAEKLESGGCSLTTFAARC